MGGSIAEITMIEVEVVLHGDYEEFWREASLLQGNCVILQGITFDR